MHTYVCVCGGGGGGGVCGVCVTYNIFMAIVHTCVVLLNTCAT